MIETFSNSLKDLEKSFMLNSTAVSKSTINLENTFKQVKVFLNQQDEIDQKEVKIAADLLEKLSIQNDYKLALLKDFPEYLSHKK